MGISSYCIQMSETEAAAGVTYGSPRSYPDEISGPEFFVVAGPDKDIECLAKSCQACQAVKRAPPVAPLHPWV